MKEYTYSVARVRAKEASLLTRQDIDQLLSADSFETALRFARDRGYRSDEGASVDEIAVAAERDLWEFITEIADEETMRVMRLPVDYHNIKASVKAAFSGIDGEDLLLDHGTVDKNLIYSCVKRREYDDLDKEIAAVCEEAMTLILRTQDGQVCDIYIDNAMLAAAEKAAENDAFIKRYTELLADTANLKTAYRCAKAGRGLSFIENAVYDGGTLNTKELENAAAAGLDTLAEYVETTPYSDLTEYMKTNAAAFEMRCDNEIMRFMQSARFDSFTSAPVAAYYYAKKAEIDAVRLILLGKLNRLDDNMIRERVRETYV